MIRKDGTISNVRSEINRKNWADPEYRARMIALLKQYKPTEATKRKVSNTLRNIDHSQWRTPEYKAKASAAHKGIRLSDEAKLKISIGNKGKTKGRPHSPDHNRKIGEALKGKKASPEALVNMRAASELRKGIPLTDESRKKISDKIKGRTLSPAHIQKMSDARKGCTMSEENRKKISEAKRNSNYKWSEESKLKSSISHRGELSPFWKGGVSFEPYSPSFGRAIKRSVRERDNHICQLCFQDTRTLPYNHAIHHIDFNKKNCDMDNLILLCHLCHIKTNMNRDWWTVHFKKVMKLRKMAGCDLQRGDNASIGIPPTR